MSDQKKVLAITIDQTEAAFRLRLKILRELLPECEFDFKERPGDFSERKKLILSAENYDAVIVQRKLLDPSHARLLRRGAKTVIFDLDDAVMVQRRKISKWSQWLKNRRYRATAKAADHVVAGNEYLAEKFREMGCAVTVLPTVVDPGHYRVKEHERTGSPALVWIGSKSTLPYLQQWMPALEDAARQVPGLRLITIANDTVKSDVIQVEHHAWAEETEAEHLARGDIGIAPTPVDQWSVGKSGFKIVQYMASGLPTIASPVGANTAILESGVTGLLPLDFAQWTEAIVRLARDVELRKVMGAAARKVVVDRYSLARAARVWRGLLVDGKEEN